VGAFFMDKFNEEEDFSRAKVGGKGDNIQDELGNSQGRV
jgi:hypothetical protein